MIEIHEIPIEKIRFDSVPRVKKYKHSLYDDLFQNGLKKPLEVEGPDKENFFYLKDGYLRMEAIKEVRKKYPSRFKTVESIIVSKTVTNTLERNLERLGEALHSSKMTGFEKQLHIEYAVKKGVQEKDLAKRFNVTVSAIRKIRKGESVPEELRREIDQLNGSQEALRIIYHLDTSKEFINYLLDKLREGEIKSIHTTPLNRVIGNKLYERLDVDEKEAVILRTIEQSEFTKDRAQAMNLYEAIKQDPKANKDLIYLWVNKLCEDVESLGELISPDVAEHLDPFQKKLIKNKMSKFITKIKWAYGEKTNIGGFRYLFNKKKQDDDIL